MRYVCLTIVLVGSCAAGIVLTQVRADDAESKDKPAQDSKSDDKPLLLLDDEPPLLLDDDAPLLLDEPDGDPKKPIGADNSRCHVCHLNFALEEIAVSHAKEEIGCSDCHGDCDAHIDDESWASGGPGTAPEIMYARDTIDDACGECHETHDAPAREILERWQARCPEITDASQVVCTDCHGHHRVNPELRKAWWDKKTGKPISKGGGETAKPAK